MKKTAILLVLVMVLSALPINSFATNVNIVIDGTELSIPSGEPRAYINRDNRTVVPVSFIAEALDIEVDWDGVNQIVTFKKDADIITLKIGENRANINRRNVTFDTRAVITQNRTFVPVRFISESFGADVDWDSETSTVIINTKNVESPKQEQPKQEEPKKEVPKQQEPQKEAFIEPVFSYSSTTRVTSLDLVNFRDYFNKDYTITAINETYPELNVVRANRVGEILTLDYTLERNLGTDFLYSSSDAIALSVVNSTKNPNLVSPKITIPDGKAIKFEVTLTRGDGTTKTYYPEIRMHQNGVVK